MYDAETGLKGGNRAYFSLEMTFRRIDGSKRIISFILPPLWNDRFSVQPTHITALGGKFAPLSCLKCWIRDKKIVYFGLTINYVYG